MMTQELFEETYHNKWVRFKGEYFTTLKDVVAYNTAALYRYEENDVTIFAVMINDMFNVAHISPEEFDKAMADIEIIKPENK